MARNGQAKVLTKDEIKRLYAVIRDNNYALRNTVMMDLSFYCGLRSHEITAVRIMDVLSTNGQVVDSFVLKGKGGRSRTVYLSNKTVRKNLKKYLETRTEDNPKLPLLKSQKTSFTAVTLGQTMKRLFVKSGIKGAKSHSGRRTFATRLIQNGCDIRHLQVLLGHSDISVTARYIQENPVQLSRLVEGL